MGSIVQNDSELIEMDHGICTQQFTVSELEHFISLLQKTLDHYKMFGIDDDTIKTINRYEWYSARDRLQESARNSKPEKKEPIKGHVYLIQNTKTKNLKIGFSKNPKSRLSTLNLASDVELILLDCFKGTMNDERNLHEKYDSMRMNSEWFEYSEEIVDHFENKS